MDRQGRANTMIFQYLPVTRLENEKPAAVNADRLLLFTASCQYFSGHAEILARLSSPDPPL